MVTIAYCSTTHEPGILLLSVYIDGGADQSVSLRIPSAVAAVLHRRIGVALALSSTDPAPAPLPVLSAAEVDAAVAIGRGIGGSHDLRSADCNGCEHNADPCYRVRCPR